MRLRNVGLMAPAVVLLLATACASMPEPASEPPPDPEPCLGQAVLIVRNNGDAEIEIVESRHGSGARNVIAILGPGVHEVQIRGEPGYAYSARQLRGATLTGTSRPRVRDRAVSLSRHCRTP